MNLKKLKQAEADFLQRYPGGFGDPGLETVRKQHNIGKLTDCARDNLGKAAFGRPEKVCTDVLTITSRSSMVSRFEVMLGMLQQHKLAKWSVISVVPFYCAPKREVLVKPTTAKGILAYLEIDEFSYHPTPTWAFYKGYQKLVKDVSSEVVPTLSDNNAAITGFLMSSM